MSWKPFISSALAIAATLVAVAPRAATTDPILGEWRTPRGKVFLEPCAGAPALVCGHISALSQPDPPSQPLRDVKNPDPKLRQRPLLGLPIMSGFKHAAAGSWTGGSIYAPGAGKTFGSNLKLNPDGTLLVQGCIGLGVCVGQTWRR